MSENKIGIYVRVDSLSDFNLLLYRAKSDGFARPDWIGNDEYLTDHDFPSYIYMTNSCKEILRSPTKDERYQEISFSDYVYKIRVDNLEIVNKINAIKSRILDYGDSLVGYDVTLKRLLTGMNNYQVNKVCDYLLGDNRVKFWYTKPKKFALETIATNFNGISFYYREAGNGVPTKTNSIKEAMLFGTRQGAERYQTPAWKIIEVTDYE